MTENKLTKRMFEYLKSVGHGVWVTKKKLVILSINAGYADSYVGRSLDELNEIIDIGRKYEDGVAYYCWYNITEDQRERYERQLTWFKSL